jgi:hypothetical protein
MLIPLKFQVDTEISDEELAKIRHESGFDELVKQSNVAEALANSCARTFAQRVMRAQVVASVQLAPNKE